MKYKKNLIIGQVPPPIGGVTIHVKRLIEHLEYYNISHNFYLLKIKTLHKLLWYIYAHKNIHLHSSNPYFKFLITIFCYCFRKNLIITNHGDLGRYNNYKDKLDEITIKLSKFPIVLNERSFNKAIKLNSNTKLISSFLPPIESEELSLEINTLINNLRINFKILCSTNASAYHQDNNGHDIYGIETLINEFLKVDDMALIVSDPSGQYAAKFEYLNNHNIKFITGGHSYYEVLKHIDVSIRNTTTDGDALSVKESLYLNKLTLASDCVNRPDGVVLFNKFNIDLVYNSFGVLKHKKKLKIENAFNELRKLYN